MRNSMKVWGLLTILMFVNNYFADVTTEHLDELAGTNVSGVFYYDTTLDDDNSWRTDATKGWYQEPAYPIDTFYGTTLDPDRWLEWEYGGGTCSYDYKVTLNTNGVNSGTVCAVYSGVLWELVGNFDITVDFENFVGSGTDGGFQISAYQGNTFCYTRRRVDPLGRYDCDVFVNGNPQQYQYETTSDTEGKLRLQRIGTTVNQYYWDGSDWDQIGDGYNGFVETNLKLSLEIWVDNAHCSVDVDNFIIRSGNTTFGLLGSAERSPVQAFPEKALIVSHDEGVDILDAGNNEMWMRFDSVDSPGEAYRDNIVAGDVEKIWAKDGLIVLGSSYGTMSGICVIDFVDDVSRFYGVPGNCWDYNSNIALRNFNTGWTVNNGYPTLLNGSVDDFSVDTIDGTKYLAVGTDMGVTVINLDNHSKKDDPGGDANVVKIGQDGALYYNSGGVFYKDETSWRPTTGNGTFAADYSATISDITALKTTSDLLFIGTLNGISKRSVADISTELYNYNVGNGLLGNTTNHVTDIAVGIETIWVGTNNNSNGGCVSIVNFNTDTSGGYYYAHPDHGDLSSNNISSLSYHSESRDLLAGTDSGADLLSGCTGDITTPENLSINIIDDEVQLDWDAVECATSYSVYSYTDPYGTYTLEESGITETNWSEPADSIKFYYVVSDFMFD